MAHNVRLLGENKTLMLCCSGSAFFKLLLSLSFHLSLSFFFQLQYSNVPLHPYVLIGKHDCVQEMNLEGLLPNELAYK